MLKKSMAAIGLVMVAVVVVAVTIDKVSHPCEFDFTTDLKAGGCAVLCCDVLCCVCVPRVRAVCAPY